MKERQECMQIWARALAGKTLAAGFLFLWLVAPCGAKAAGGTVVAWGSSEPAAVPPGLANVVAVAAGDAHGLARTSDGHVIGWGQNGFGPATVPDTLTYALAIGAGAYHSLAVRNDRTVIAWGLNINGQTIVPLNLSNVVAVAGGESHSMALRKDGSVAVWGNFSGQTNGPQGTTNVVAIASGRDHCLALKTDGTIIVWGSQTNVPSELTNAVAISAGYGHNMALRSDGTVLVWGTSCCGQTDVPPGLDNVVAIAAGGNQCLALQRDGTIVAWGNNSFGQISVPAGLTNPIAIGTGAFYSMAVLNNGSAFITRHPFNQVKYSGASVQLSVGAMGAYPLTYYWRLNGTNIDGATNSLLMLKNIQPAMAGNYSVVVSNSLGLITSSNATLTVITSAPIITVQPTNQVFFSGSNATFMVAAIGSLPMDYQWQFNETNIAGATNTSLFLTNIQPVNNGNYAVVVSNTFGWVTSSNATLTVVTSAPIVLSQPTNQTVLAGTNVTLTVTAHGSWPIGCQWQLNGTNLPSATNATLNLDFIQVSQTGIYSVLVSNSVGTVTCSNVLNVLPFFITQQPQSRSVWMGGTVGFDVGAIGLAPLSYQWQLNGDDLPAATDPVLVLTNVQPNQLGPYVVVISNMFGVLASSSATLTASQVAAWGDNSYGQTNLPPGLTNVLAIAAGADFNLALKSDGTVTGWGANSYGQTTPPTDLSNVVAIAAGYNHGMALKGDGTLVGWGRNTDEYENYRGQTVPPVGLSNVLAVAAGGGHTLALKSNGTVVAWGYNNYGQTNVPIGLSNVVAIAGGYYHSLALKSDGTIVSWGYSANGLNSVPANANDVATIAAGFYHSLALKRDGTVVAWGSNSDRQTNAPGGLSNVVAIAGGRYHSVALKSDGTVVGWGSNSYGQTNSLASLHDIMGIAVGAFHNLVLLNDGTPVILWQPSNRTAYSGTTAQLSLGAAGSPPLNYHWLFNGTNIAEATGDMLTLTNVQLLDAGGYSVMVSNSYGAVTSSVATLTVTDSPPLAATSLTNLFVSFGSNAVLAPAVTGSWPLSYRWQFNGADIDGATSAVLGLTNLAWASEGTYSVIVSNAYGAVTSSVANLIIQRSKVVVWGGFNQQMTNVPTKVRNPVALAAGFDINLALNSDGTVAAWGPGYWTNAPVNLTNAVGIAAGFQFGLAVKSDGRVVGWGNNSNGQTNPPANLTNAVAVAAGDYHGLALRNDGTVVGWGNNSFGQTNPPVGLSNVVAIAAGGASSFALKSDGTVLGWGSNSGGLTNGAKGLSNIVAVATGGGFAVALKNDGMVVAWGSSLYNLTNSARGLSNVQAVAVGSSHALSLDSSGKVTGLGNNSSGQTNIPAALSNVIAVAAGNYSVALSSFGPPLVYRQPTDRMSYAGMPVLFTASVLGSRPLSCQWQFNGTNIDGATNLLLSLTNVQTVNAGPYNVIVSNSFGDVTSSNALLTVITNPPMFVVQPGDRFALASSNVTFLAMATGPIPISYQWQFNGTNIAGATNTSLVLTNVQLTNQGNYAVAATNAFGAATSSNAFLNIIDLAEALNATNLVWTISTNPAWFPQTTTTHDGVAAGGCVVTNPIQWSVLQTTVNGPGTLTFWWQLVGYSFAGSYSFTIDGANQASVSSTGSWQQKTFYIPEGSHTLQWNHFLNYSSYTLAAYLDQVNYSPGPSAAVIATPLSDKSVPAGTNVTFTVTAGGTPPLSYVWQFGGTNIAQAANASFSLKNVQTNLAGVYTVIVTNRYGPPVSSSATLLVNPSAPWILTNPATREMVRGGEAAFAVSARGSEPLHYQWEFNFANVSGGTNAALILSNVQSSNAGIYRVTVSNDYGSVTSSFAELKIVPMVIVGWGNDFFGQVTIPFGLTNVAAIGAGWDFSLAAKHNEPVVDWGFPVSDLPSGLTNVVAVVGGSSHSLALGSDGVVTGAGSGSAAVPPPLTNAVGIGAGSSHSIAVKSDGSVVVWGSTSSGRDDIPSDLTNAVAVAGGWLHDMALRSDGSVVAWGSNSFGQTNVPPGLSNVVSIAAGWYHSLAVKDDGAVVAWGRNISGQTNAPSGLTNVVAVAGGIDCSIALNRDGTVVAWGGGHSDETNVPTWLTNVVAIASGQDHNLALLNDGSPYVTRQPWNQTVSSGDTATLRAVVMGTRPMSYQWQLNGTNIDGATNAVLTLTNLPLTAAGSYLCAISNSRGTVLSLPAKLTILRSMPQFDVAPGLHWTNGSFSLRLSGLSGHGDIIIHASSNLLDWEPVLTNPPLVGTLQVLDPSATNRPTRFYRAEEK